ncbi:MAG: uracil-DNA glycosylase family protein [Kiloniellales bacterium]
MSDAPGLQALLEEIRACQVCAAHLPHGPRPVLRVRETAQVMIVGQAPGRRVHETGIPWNDPSGDRLRRWLGVDRATFYDAGRIAIVPTGFCYPGTVDGADLPPRPECAPLWHPRLLPHLPKLALTVLVGRYAQAYHLGQRCRGSVRQTVAAWREFAPAIFPTPHPSWRSTAWLKRNPWFEAEVLPALRARLNALL